MEKRIHLYVSRKHPALWLAALLLLASAIARVVVLAQAPIGGFWSCAFLPAAATVLFVLLCLLAGQEMLYKTAIPIWLLGISAAWQLYGPLQQQWLAYTVACICILFFCISYTCILSGRWRYPWLLLPMYAIVFGIGVYLRRQALPEGMSGALFLMPEYLMLLGLVVLLCAMKVHTDGRYHPTWGDRADGRRIRSTPAIDQISPYIMVNRTGANNLFSESVEITALERYVHSKRRAGMTGLGITHVIFTAYARTVARYPAVNRFVAGQKVYSRGEDIALSMTVKKELSLHAPDTVIKVHLTPYDTLEDVYRKFNQQVEEVKSTPLDSSMDNTAGIMTMIPGIVLKFVVWLLKTLDYFGQIPAFLLEISPFHGSAYFTSMGSLGIHPVYHHLYDFGTIPLFCAFGKKRRVEELENGEPVVRKYMDMKFNLDERICDGYYYASVIKYFLRLLSHPEQLELPPAAVEKDVP